MSDYAWKKLVEVWETPKGYYMAHLECGHTRRVALGDRPGDHIFCHRCTDAEERSES